MDANQYTSVTEALLDLSKRGFADSFSVRADGLHNSTTGTLLRPEDATIVEYHRLEGETDPADMAVVYAIEGKDGTRGVLIDAYGAYADADVGEILKKIKLKEGL